MADIHHIALAAALLHESVESLPIEIRIGAEARRIFGYEGLRLRVGQGRQNAQTAGADPKGTARTDSERKRLDRKRPDASVDCHGVVAVANSKEHGIPRLRRQGVQREGAGIAESVILVRRDAEMKDVKPRLIGSRLASAA